MQGKETQNQKINDNPAYTEIDFNGSPIRVGIFPFIGIKMVKMERIAAAIKK